MAIKKAYGYMTRMKDGAPQVLVFQHINLEAGIQIPKGTVDANETPLEAVIREMKEETGLVEFVVDGLLAEDFWENDDGAIHHRYFYKILLEEAADEWDYQPTGGGAEEGLTFHFFWINNQQEVKLVRGHGDYLDYIFHKTAP